MLSKLVEGSWDVTIGAWKGGLYSTPAVEFIGRTASCG